MLHTKFRNMKYTDPHQFPGLLLPVYHYHHFFLLLGFNTPTRNQKRGRSSFVQKYPLQCRRQASDVAPAGFLNFKVFCLLYYLYS